MASGKREGGTNGRQPGKGNGKAHGKTNGRSDGKVAARASAAAKRASDGGGEVRANGSTDGQARGKRSRLTATRARLKARAQGERAADRSGRPARGGSPQAFSRAKGTLVIIGGAEDKEGEKLILRLVADEVGSGKLVVATVASSVPDELWEGYERVFRRLGVKHVHHLDIESREEAKSDAKLRVLEGADAVFFTGGDQLKITSQLGDSPIYERLREIYEEGGLIAGTSAGASVVCETMMVRGPGDESMKIGASLHMAPGFGLISGVIIDQHFAQRGRIGRLLGAVAQNPRMLGIGIDEDTAIVCRPGRCFEVIGEGAVYVLDGQDVTYTNLTDEAQERTLSAFGVRLHVLSMGDTFDMATRIPTNRPAEEVEAAILGG